MTEGFVPPGFHAYPVRIKEGRGDRCSVASVVHDRQAPFAMQASPLASSSQSHQTLSETISRGSSAILDEIADLDSFAPDTPPQNAGFLAAECSSENDPHTATSCMCH